MGYAIETPDLEVTDSLLKVNGHYLPLGSSANLDQSYDEEELGGDERNLAQSLTFFGMEVTGRGGGDVGAGFRLSTTVNCSGCAFVPPIWSWGRGVDIELECAEPMMMNGFVLPENLWRKHVPGSIRYMGKGRGGLTTLGLEGMAPSGLVLHTQFRPILQVRVSSKAHNGNDARKREKAWSVTFRESGVYA